MEAKLNKKEVTAIAFHPKHLEIMVVRDKDNELFSGFNSAEAIERFSAMARSSVQCLTFLYDGRVLMIAGFCQLWPGVYDVWMLPSVYAKEAPVAFARLLKRYVDRIQEDFAAHRIQTVSFCDEFHEKWMNFLGFQKEGILRSFTVDKQDMCNYSRIS